ncbi:uncharacterized protein VICG_00777 [Vittaforma corneae ATCC 50505]|uniref:Trm112p-like protein n=1 Tax=Vittaforma corneae (strain ATCC 50505) TaxID=993615 RepID=L2GMU2_VITCO|nr:uncharacterized protein VICG_00777 [Vittaforma corneae ATCC 50505]ELA42136.1 hypothetical protein VICG_00777 [Vittaforma corneae ATCC 50505]
MRPFLCSILKCQKCGSTQYPKLNPEEVFKVALPAHLPSISKFREQQSFLSDLIDVISKNHGKIFDINEADLYAFLEPENATSIENLKIIELLYGVDIVAGTITCVDCGDTKNIKNGILFCEE